MCIFILCHSTISSCLSFPVVTAQSMGGDGQVTAGSVVIKPNVQKVRRLGENIVVGFAGSTADALTLFERLEDKLGKHPNQLMRACVELAKAWRTDKYLRKLEVSQSLLWCWLNTFTRMQRCLVDDFLKCVRGSFPFRRLFLLQTPITPLS